MNKQNNRILVLGLLIGILLVLFVPKVLMTQSILYFFLPILLGIIFLTFLTVIPYQLVFKNAPYVPSKDAAVNEMLNMSNVQPNERVVDLGSGDGKILFAFAQRGAECHGFEVNPILILISKVRVFFSKTNGKIHIHPKNFWKEDLSTYDIIIIYGLSTVMARLERKLLNQKGKSNMKVISNVFTFPNLEYTEKRGEVYLYII